MVQRLDECAIHANNDYSGFLSNMVVIPSEMGRLNKRALLDRLQALGTASRVSLAKSLGLSQPTAGKIVD